MPQQTRIVFENLSVLQQSIQNNWALPKRPHHEDVSTLTQSTNEMSTNASSNKKSSLSHPLSTEDTQRGQTTRQPHKPMDTNIPHIRSSHHNQKDTGSSKGISTTSKQNYRDIKRAERWRLYKNKKKENRKHCMTAKSTDSISKPSNLAVPQGGPQLEPGVIIPQPVSKAALPTGGRLQSWYPFHRLPPVQIPMNRSVGVDVVGPQIGLHET
jgi:hypothetical protein